MTKVLFRSGLTRTRSKGSILSVDCLPLQGLPVHFSRRDGPEPEHRRWRAKPPEDDDFSDPDDEVVLSTLELNGESPRTPKYFPGEAPLQPRTSILLRPADNSPFTPLHKRGVTGSSDNVSTPYSLISGISSYEYEDDFTSDESEYSAMTHGSRTTSQTRIPIKRSSSLHRRKGLLMKGTAGNSIPPSPTYVPETNGHASPGSARRTPDRREFRRELEQEEQLPEHRELPRTPTRKTFSSNNSEYDTSSKPQQSAKTRKAPRTKSVSPHVGARAKEEPTRLSAAKSTSDLPSKTETNRSVEDTVDAPKVPRTEPPTRRSVYKQSISVPASGRRTAGSVAAAPRRGTAGSSSSSGGSSLTLVTVPSLKSPFDGIKVVLVQ